MIATQEKVSSYPKTFQLPPDISGIFNSKIKLHGTNAHILITSKGVRVGARSTKFGGCTNGNHFGLLDKVNEDIDYFNKLQPGLVILGDWCGRKIQRKVVCSQIPEKTFFVFGVMVNQEMIVDLEYIDFYLGNYPKWMVVLPYFKKYHLPYDYDTLLLDVSEINQEDPLIKELFGISGVGEGLVLYRKSGFPLKDFEENVFQLTASGGLTLLLP